MVGVAYFQESKSMKEATSPDISMMHRRICLSQSRRMCPFVTFDNLSSADFMSVYIDMQFSPDSTFVIRTMFFIFHSLSL